MRKKLFIKFLIIFLIAFAGSVVAQEVFHISLKELQAFVDSFGLLAPIVYSIILTLGISVPFNPVSDYLTVNLAAFLFNPLLAIIATFAAHTLSLSINYWVARSFGWGLLTKVTSKDESAYLEDLSGKIHFSQIFWLRWLLPITAVGIDVVSYAAGLANLKFYRFYLVSIVPWTIINIAFFSFTNFVIDRSAILFFVPGTIIVITPIVVFYLLKKNTHVKGRDFLVWVGNKFKQQAR